MVKVLQLADRYLCSQLKFKVMEDIDNWLTATAWIDSSPLHLDHFAVAYNHFIEVFYDQQNQDLIRGKESLMIWAAKFYKELRDRENFRELLLAHGDFAMSICDEIQLNLTTARQQIRNMRGNIDNIW